MRESKPEEAEILVQKLPSDMGIHRNPRKGTLNAPEKILENFDFERKVLVDEVFPDEFDLEETQRRIYENTRDLAEYDKPILSIGGDHSVIFPVIKALKEENPGLKLVWLDAHLDLKEKVGEHFSHDVVVRELLESGFDEDEIVFVGITRKDQDEEELLKEHDMEIYGPDEPEDFKREFNWDEQPVYLSVDIDVLGVEEAPGTGYPDGELSLGEVKDVIETVMPYHGDIVEVAPPFDQDGKTVESAREVLKVLLGNVN
jgi:arginase family enzyme